MDFETCTVTDRGGRTKNEDSVNCYYQSGFGGCWVVADGLGGHAAGEVASAIAAEAIVEKFRQSPRLEAGYIRECFGYALDRILNRQEDEPMLKSMRTTAVALFTDCRGVTWAHVGDSRLYFFRGGALTFQTLDHSVSQACVRAGEITPEQIRFHEDRNRLLKVLGTDANLKVEIRELSMVPQKGDAFLLCTDGFWEYVLEGEMEEDLHEADSPKTWLGRMSRRLLNRVGKENDNYTAAAVLIR
jgi:serine/threonine protein phosphatase PrpC